MLKSKDIRERLKDIEEYLLAEYKETRKEQETKRDWRTYEQRLMRRIQKAMRNLEPLIDEAVSTIKIKRGKGKKPSLTLRQKVMLLLLKELFGKSNRMMASMLMVFSFLSGVDVGYKTVERLYSDPLVEMAIHNLHVLILQKKGVNHVDAAGDGTGYSLSIRRHYASEVKKRKDKVKDKEGNGAKAFVYSFKMLDIQTNMYVCYGMSLRSEKEAFDKAMLMLEEIDVEINSARLDKYYSCATYVDRFNDATVYVIPKKNATLRGSRKWKQTMKCFVYDTLEYLEEYYKRNNSEAGFSTDKRWFGWKIEQRREDRIETALNCGNIWHNLFNLYTD